MASMESVAFEPFTGGLFVPVHWLRAPSPLRLIRRREDMYESVHQWGLSYRHESYQEGRVTLLYAEPEPDIMDDNARADLSEKDDRAFLWMLWSLTEAVPVVAWDGSPPCQESGERMDAMRAQWETYNEGTPE